MADLILTENRLPDSNRICDRDRIFLDDYRASHDNNVEELMLAYGDTIILLRELKVPVQTPDVTGKRLDYKDKFGGRRVNTPTVTAPSVTSYGRPEEGKEPLLRISIPTIVESTRESKIVTARGIDFDGDYIAHISRKWMDDRNLKIELAGDRFVYKDVKFRATQFERYGLFLDGFSEYILVIKREAVD